MLKIILVSILLLSSYSIEPGDDSISENINTQIVHQILNNIPNSYNSSNQLNLLLFVNFADFYCPHCIDDFLMFSNSLNEILYTIYIPVIVILRRNEFQSEELQIHMMNGWIRGNDINFPFYLDTWDIFKQAQIEKTSVLLIDQLGGKLIYQTFPMGWKKRNEIIRFIETFDYE